MFSPRWRKVLRDAWLHKPRTFLVVLAMATGIIGAGSVLNTWSLLRRVTRDGYLATNPASATLRVDSVDPALLERVRAMPALQDAQARRTALGTVESGGTRRTAVLFATSDFAAVRIGKIQPEAGAWPPVDGAMVLEKSSVEFSGLGVGDSVAVRVGDGKPVMLPVTGIARDAGLAPGWMEHVVYGFVTPATLARLGVPVSLNQLQIVVRKGALDRQAIRRVAFDVKALVEASGHRVADVEVPEPGRHIHAAQMDSLLYIQGAFGLLALLLSGLLVINLVGAMLAGQVREIGVMKAIGARPSQIAAMYLGLALLLGLVASAVSLPVAALIGRAYAKFAADLLNFDVAGAGIPSGAFVVQVAVGVLVPVVAAAIPVTRWCGIGVGQALRDFGIDGTSGPHGAATGGWLGRVGGITRPLLLSLRNAFRRRQRMGLTLLTLGMGGAVYIGALNLRSSIHGSVDVLFTDLMRFQMSIRFVRPYPADSIEVLARQVAGVAGAEAWSGARAGVAQADGTLGNTFAVTALPPDSKMVGYRLERGRWLVPADRGALVVNRRLLQEEPGLAMGREATLIIAGQPSRWMVVGVVESGPSPGAYVTRDALAAVTGDARARLLVIAASDRSPASQSELVQRVRNELGRGGFEVESSQLLLASRSAMEDHLLMVAGFLMIMSQLVIVVGGLGLASTMSLAVLERTREIGVLRAIGARHRAILTMIQVEGLVISLASWLVAIPLSLPMSVILGRAFGRVMIPVEVTWVPELWAVMAWLGVVLAVSLLACAWPAYRAMRITTRAALAYE